jgi:5-methylcytosine-specific restriction enzyme subunit McrC
LSRNNEPITVFEHETLRFDKGEKRITPDQFKALQSYYGEGVDYYSLCHNGVQFNEYVGAIQVGSTLIEVLPKADKMGDSKKEEKKWRDILIGMLKAAGSFTIKTTSESSLKIKPNTILDLYFEMFIHEVEFLLHHGLVKKYRKKDGNVTALKGSLLFGKQIQQNLSHQERFYVRHTTFDIEHQLHFILYKTLCLIRHINTNMALQGSIGALLLNFPEMPDLRVSEATFDKIILNRKTQAYKKALEIARLLLLKYHPDVTKGRNHVLAIMFDMNKLWERFVYVSLRKKFTGSGITVTAQTSKYFWKPDTGHRSKIRPDILLNKDKEDCVVLDTKWKNLNGKNPSPDDLRQMYVYHEYYEAKKVGLVYPGFDDALIKGNYLHKTSGAVTEKECTIIPLPVEVNIKEWQEAIKDKVEAWIRS